MAMYRCSQCHQGEMLSGFVDDHDMSPFFGLDARLTRAAALVCNHCGEATLDGSVIEAAERALGRLVVRGTGPLRPNEVRFLRGLMGLSQQALAERLGVHRVSVARWETDTAPVGALESFAIRTMAAWHVDDADLARAVASVPRPSTEPEGEPYRLDPLAA
jgi:putative zinc finger/helix-turn-helix YgiT family protein